MRPDAPGLLPEFTPDERFRELACLLAAGLRALRDRAFPPAEPAATAGAGTPD